MTEIRFVGGSNTSRVVNSTVQLCTNWIPELDQDAKHVMRLLGRPGLLSFASVSAAANRGAINWNGVIYTVVGNTFWSITTAGVATVIGTINTVSGFVDMAVGRSNMMFVDGTDGWFYDGTTLTRITDVDFPNATVVAWIDEYFIVDDPDNPGRMYRSDANDPSAWGALNFATAERNPDGIINVYRSGQTLMVVGNNSTEAWYNDASEGFSFAPISGAITEVGGVGKAAVREAAGIVFWLSRTAEGQGAVFMAQGLQGVPISTPAMELIINAGGDLSGAEADIVYLEGHLIYLLHIPDGKTIAYDTQTRLWHEWKTYLRDDFRGRNAVHVNGVTYVGDDEGSNFFKLDWDTYTDQGSPIEHIRRDRHVLDRDQRRNLRHRVLELEFESGVGTASLDPQVMLRWSRSGHQWSKEHWRGFGKVGEYGKRTRWSGLGSARDRVYEVKVTDPVKTNLVGGWLTVE